MVYIYVSLIVHLCIFCYWNFIYNTLRHHTFDLCFMSVNTHPHIEPRLKKEQSYTSTLPLGLHGLFQGELYFYLYLYQHLLHALVLVMDFIMLPSIYLSLLYYHIVNFCHFPLSFCNKLLHNRSVTIKYLGHPNHSIHSYLL